MNVASIKCVRSGSQTGAFIAAHTGHHYTIRPACGLTGTALCHEGGHCHIAGHDGLLYNVFQDRSAEPLPWQACLTRTEAHHLGGITPGLVRHAFHHLTWPASPLIVQPPHGRTLVNLATNFYTTNTHPTTQTVTLLGQHVTIQATPTRYTWHLDPTDPSSGVLTTTSPGAPYPDLQITHHYQHPGTARPRLDTTYTGRYRINTGPWHPIPDTLTITGTPHTLHILTATPHLLSP